MYNISNDNYGNERGKEAPPPRMAGKVPPHSNDAEVAVLGAMMLEMSAVARVTEILKTEAFYNASHQMIFDVILALFEKNTTVDIVTLTEELLRRDMLDKVGGAYYLSEINASTPTAANVVTHARIVQEKFLKRQLIKTAGQILADAYDESTDALEEIDKAEASIFQISEQRIQNSYQKIKSVARDAMDMIAMLAERDKEGVSGVPSGFKKLDDLTGGFQNTDLIIIAGRPSMGKTAFALSFARNAAVEYKIPVGIFSIEMSAIQLVMRLISGESRINGNDIRNGKIKSGELQKIARTIGRIADAPIVIDPSPSLSVMELRAKCRRMISEHKVKMIIIDYLQLMHSPRAESREREISMISQALKQIAKELNVPIIALSQLNRSVESRTDKRPMLSDLRESGSIEQDADVVCFVHRPEYYGIEHYDDEARSTTEGTAEIIIGKQRNGPVGTARLAYQKDYARFENLEFTHLQPPEEMQNFPEQQPF